MGLCFSACYSAPALHPESDSRVGRLVSQGYAKLSEDRYAEALALYKDAASRFAPDSGSDEEIAYVKALNNIGYIYLFSENDPDKAYPYLLRAKKTAIEGGYDDLLGAIYDNMAKIQLDFGDVDGAIDTYTLALNHAVADTTDVSDVIQLMIFNDLVVCAITHDKTDRLKEPLDIFSTLPQYSIPMGGYAKKTAEALGSLLEGRLENATDFLNQAWPLIDSKVEKPRYQTDHQLMLATVYHMRQMEDSARHALDRAFAIADENGLVDRMPRIHRGFGFVLKAEGNIDGANRRFLRAHEIDDSLHNAKTYAHISSLEPILDIDMLTERMNAEVAKQKNRLTVIWILSAAVAVICALLFLISRRNKRLNLSYAQLVARHRESMRDAEAATRLRHQYMMTIENLKNDNDRLRHEASLREAAVAKDVVHPDASAEYASKSPIPVDENDRLRIAGLVNDIMEQSDDVFSPDFSLDRLAALVGTKPRYLSAILNESLGKSLSRLLAETRVKKACEMLLSDDFKCSLTVESVALAVGYKSRTQFTSIFKKITGLTPTQYIAATE